MSSRQAADVSDTDMPAISRHLETWVELDELGKRSSPYRPTHRGFHDYIDTFHLSLTEAPRNGILIDLGIAGWLRPADALKLYELAYFSRGDVLEFGTNRGLSTYIIASALKRAAHGFRVATVELDERFMALAQANLSERRVADAVEFHPGDAAIVGSRFIAQRRGFDMCFVDHSHAFEPMVEACKLLPELVLPGGFVVFHDFNDRRNTRTQNVGESGSEYGVYAAIEATLDRSVFDFCGIYGCCAVFRNVSAAH